MPLTTAQKAKLSRSLQKIARKVDKMLEQEIGERVGYSLIIWGAFGKDNMVQYVSNSGREDNIRNMEGLLKVWKEGMPDIPYHERE